MADHAHLDPEVILQHAGFVRSLARGLLRDEALVDDVVQETLLRALEKGPRKREALVAWLRTVTRNIAFKSYRGTARREAREEEAARPERLPATFDLVAKSETLKRLTAAVMELPEPAREIILLRYYEGLGNAEIAERLGIGKGAVRMRVHRAQKTLTEALDRSTEGDRGTWMAGLAALAGIRPEDLHPEALETAAGTGLSGAAVAWTAAFGLVIGTFAWIASTGTVERLDQTVAQPADQIPSDLASTASLVETEDRSERLEREVVAIGYGHAQLVLPGATESDENAAEYPTGNLVGRVVDEKGEPVSGARVHAAWGRFPMAYKATTNARGRFGLVVPTDLFENARIGKYPILLAATATHSAPTRVWAWPMDWSTAAPSKAAPCEPRATLPLRGASGTLEGVVLSAGGSPLRGASIELGERTRFGLGFLGYQSAETPNHLASGLASTIERGARLTFKGNTDMRGTLGRHALDARGHRARLQPALNGRSRASGAFRFAGIDPGIQRIRISAPGHAAWTGTVDVARGGVTRRRFQMKAEAVVSGPVRRSDGLSLETTLVHALQTRPWEVTTVKVASDGTYTLRGLRPGHVRIVAEERTPRSNTPPRVAELEFELVAGAHLTKPLELHATPTRSVRFVMRDGTERHALAGQRVDLRGLSNPLLTVATLMTDGEGRVDIPTETVVPCHWLLVGGAEWRTVLLGSGAALRPTTPVAVIAPPADFALSRDPTAEVVIEIDAADLTLCRAKLRVVSMDDLDAAQDVMLLPPHNVFTHVGRPGVRPDTVEFRTVPAGRYRLLVPYHGLGWLSPTRVNVPALANGAEFDLGTVRLPRLGTLELRPSTELEGSRWMDLTIQSCDGDFEIRVFDGRVEIPSSIPIAPGRYILRAGGERDPYVREIVVREAQQVDVLWPID